MMISNREIHSVIGSIPGIPEPASWAEEGHTSSISVNVEIFEGERLAYVLACDEEERTVRVDLDRRGWELVWDYASEVLRRMDQANAAEIA